MLHILWRFRAKADKVEEFRRVYAGNGDWAKLFARAADYRGTELWEDLSDPAVFVVVDHWGTREAYERFRRQFGAEYEALDESCCELTDEETPLGNFWSATPDAS